MASSTAYITFELVTRHLLLLQLGLLRWVVNQECLSRREVEVKMGMVCILCWIISSPTTISWRSKEYSLSYASSTLLETSKETCRWKRESLNPSADTIRVTCLERRRTDLHGIARNETVRSSNVRRPYFVHKSGVQPCYEPQNPFSWLAVVEVGVAVAIGTGRHQEFIDCSPQISFSSNSIRR